MIEGLVVGGSGGEDTAHDAAGAEVADERSGVDFGGYGDSSF